MFNPSIDNMSPTYFQFSSQSSASRPGSVDLGAFSNTSPQTLIHSSPNLQYSDFANPYGLDTIDLNDDEIGNQRQLGTDQKSDIFWNRINNYCEEHNPTMKGGIIATKKRWYKFSKAVAPFAGCYDQATRNIRSGSLSIGTGICFVWNKNG
ncbi:hypothetical protein PIB30_072071 [Stylosanthes scabra]|uniref:Uncharacterized protein n=1 Tax=Stylosanthes scabra TaxID=79078 RepID=A0ABU6VPX2_9FABA|nr:hypothetical protein [Stylosanthes scabra]